MSNTLHSSFVNIGGAEAGLLLQNPAGQLESDRLWSELVKWTRRAKTQRVLRAISEV
jgi:hypothetical protein